VDSKAKCITNWSITSWLFAPSARIPRPFLDLLDVDSKESQRIWQSEPPFYEYTSSILSDLVGIRPAAAGGGRMTGQPLFYVCTPDKPVMSSSSRQQAQGGKPVQSFIVNIKLLFTAPRRTPASPSAWTTYVSWPAANR